MLIKTGEGKFLELVDGEENIDDSKTRTSLDKAKKAIKKSEENLSKDGNKKDSSKQADELDAETNK